MTAFSLVNDMDELLMKMMVVLQRMFSDRHCGVLRRQPRQPKPPRTTAQTTLLKPKPTQHNVSCSGKCTFPTMTRQQRPTRQLRNDLFACRRRWRVVVFHCLCILFLLTPQKRCSTMFLPTTALAFAFTPYSKPTGGGRRRQQSTKVPLRHVFWASSSSSTQSSSNPRNDTTVSTTTTEPRRCSTVTKDLDSRSTPTTTTSSSLVSNTTSATTTPPKDPSTTTISTTTTTTSATTTTRTTATTTLGDIMGLVTESEGLTAHYGICHPLDRVALTANGNLQRIVSSYYDAPVSVVVEYSEPRTAESSTAIENHNSNNNHNGTIFTNDNREPVLPPPPPTTCKTWDRRVALQIFGQTFCVATSVIRVQDPQCVAWVESGQVGLGQLFRYLNVLPTFRLHRAGMLTTQNNRGNDGNGNANDNDEYQTNNRASSNTTAGLRQRGEGGGFWREYSLECPQLSCDIHEEFVDGLWSLTPDNKA